MQDNKAEETKITAEIKRLEAQAAEESKYQNEQQQREVVQKRKAAEARLKVIQLRQQQLAEEEKRQQEMTQERTKFESEQKQREQELTANQKAEEQRLTALKAELAKKKQTTPASSGGSLATAVAEMKRLNAEIDSIEAAVGRELAAGKGRITSRYTAEIVALRQAAKQKQIPLVRDEFETEAEYRARVTKQQSSYQRDCYAVKEVT